MTSGATVNVMIPANLLLLFSLLERSITIPARLFSRVVCSTIERLHTVY